MMREYVSLGDTNSTSIQNYDSHLMYLFYQDWPGIITSKSIAGDFSYNEDIQSYLCDATDSPWKTLETIIQGLFRREYYDAISDLLSLIIDVSGVMDRQEFFKPEFLERVEKRIIFNERYKRAKKIGSMAHELVARMVDDTGNRLSDQHHLLSISQVKKIIVYILATQTILCMSIPEDGKHGLAA